MRPKKFFFTLEGRIGIICSLSEHYEFGVVHSCIGRNILGPRSDIWLVTIRLRPDTGFGYCSEH